MAHEHHRGVDDVRAYYNQQLADAQASGAGLIWFMGRDHLSPPLLNVEHYALHPEYWRAASSERILRMTRRMGIGYGDRVLDIGTGIGGPGRDVINDTGCKLWGVNISDAQIGNLRSLSLDGDARYRNLAQADMQHLPFANRMFDHAFSVNAIYRVSDAAAVIRESVRVLRKGGKIGVDDWFTTDAATPDVYQQLRHNWSTTTQGFHNINTFVQTMEATGLRILEIMDFTEEAGAFLSEKRFGRIYDTQVAPSLVEAFPKLYQYPEYEPVHAEQAAQQLRSDILYMGTLYRGGQAVYRQIVAEKP